MPTTTDGSTRRRARRSLDPEVATDSFGARIDAPLTASLSSAPTDGPATAPNHPWSAPSPLHALEGHELVAVGPGRVEPMLGLPMRFAGLGFPPMNPLPVRAAKIDAPYLREDTLSRVRLNGWLERAARGRVTVIVGDAGFGKTTLLIDWSKRTKRRTAWYRLERDDRDWLTFMRHLVASGRELEPGFAPETYRLLCHLGPGGPTQAELMASLSHEMAAFGEASSHGFSVLLDDYHHVDRSEETDPIIAALLQATGPGFSLILTARTDPELPPVKLRGRNAVHQLNDDDLRFTAAETEALFNDAYRIPLERDVAIELARRTEGWAALLSLVRTRLEEQADPDPRALVTQLSATKGDLYDYLAEEVLADLSPEMHDFLMRISILREVDPRLVRLLDNRDADAVAEMLHAAERARFLYRSAPTAAPRFNPLVRQALAGRLEAAVGRDEFRRLNRLLAEQLEATDWKAAAWHYRAAADPASAARTIDAAVPSIIALGEFGEVAPFLDGTAGPTDRVGALILRSRVEFARGNLDRALTLAREATSKADGGLAGTAILNIAALEGVAGFADDLDDRAASALSGRLVEAERSVVEAARLLRGAQTRGNLAVVADALQDLANRQEFSGLARYASISRVNLANVLIWLGDLRAAVRAAVQAEAGFDDESGVEQGAALTARATALVQLGKVDEADLILRRATSANSALGRTEALLEAALLEANYGSIERSKIALEKVDLASLPAAYVSFSELTQATIALRGGDASGASSHAERCRNAMLRDICGEFRMAFLSVRCVGRAAGEEQFKELFRLAASQASRPARVLTSLLCTARQDGPIGSEVTSLAPDDRHALSVLAEEICLRLADLSSSACEIVRQEAHLRPERWTSALRLAIAASGKSTEQAAGLLSEIGNREDAEFLRLQAKSARALRDHAAAAIRRLAPRGLLRDLGVVHLELSGGASERPSRRKAMALLCFLATRPRQAATRDEAVEALWPDCSPEMGLNSLHQAIYYVRRIFDPDFREGVSAGYLTFDGEIVMLDQELVDSESSRCWRLLRSTSVQDLDAAEQLLAMYHSRFAIDFMYEDWASDYRETLHAAVLGRVEASIQECVRSGNPERAIALGTAVLAVEPSADSIELSLLRAYKAAGRLAAAREQYAHYSSTLREELGIEPPAFDAI